MLEQKILPAPLFTRVLGALSVSGTGTDIYFLLFHTIQWLSCILRIKTKVLNKSNQNLHVLDPLCTLVASPSIFPWNSQSCSQAASLVASEVSLLRGYLPFPNQRHHACNSFCLSVHSPANFGSPFRSQLRCWFLKKALRHPPVQIRFYCEMHSWSSVLPLSSHFDSQYRVMCFFGLAYCLSHLPGDRFCRAGASSVTSWRSKIFSKLMTVWMNDFSETHTWQYTCEHVWLR